MIRRAFVVLALLFLMMHIKTSAVCAYDSHNGDKLYKGKWYYKIYNTKTGYRKGELWITGYKGNEKKIKIPSKINGKNVIGIDYAAFSYNNKVEILVVSKGIKSIDVQAFCNCKNLKKAVLSSGLESIGESAFGACVNLSIVTLPESIKTIKKNAFNACFSLTSISVPESVKKIEEGTFSGCRNLKKISFNSGVKTIDAAFDSCISLEEVVLPDSVEKISTEAFNYCESIKIISVSNDNSHYASVDGVLTNKDKTKLLIYPKGKKIQEYIVPASIKNINGGAFFGAKYLERIDLNCVEVIGVGAFCGCERIEKIEVRDSVKNIFDECFMDCQSLKEISFPVGVVFKRDLFNIDNSSSPFSILNNCSKLEKVEFFNDFDCGFTFFGCKKLKEITIDDHNKSFASVDGVMYDKDLKEIIRYPNALKNDSFKIPDSVIKMGQYAFYDCVGVRILYTNNVEKIPTNAFWKSGLNIIVIADKVRKIEPECFVLCNDLERIDVSSDNDNYSSLKGVLMNKNKTTVIKCPENFKLKKYTIPASVKIIKENSFVQMKKTKKIVVPKTVTKIERMSFDQNIQLLVKKGSYAYDRARKLHYRYMIN